MGPPAAPVADRLALPLHLENALRKLVRSAGLRHSLLDVALTHALRDERRWRRFLRYAPASHGHGT